MAADVYSAYQDQQQDDWFATNAPPAPPPVDPGAAGLKNSVETAAPVGSYDETGQSSGQPDTSNGPGASTAPPAGGPTPNGGSDVPGDANAAWNNWGPIANAYQNLLGRPAGGSEIQFWRDQIMANPAADWYSQIYNSPEAQKYRGSSGTGGTMRNILAPFTGSWTPQNAPVFGQGGSPITPFNFSRQLPVFQKFDAPTLEQAQNEPGFQLALQEGQEGIQNSAAGRGLVRSGGTLKDILKYNQNFGNQNYQNVYNRGFNTWQANTSGDLNNWLTGANADLNKYNTNVSTQYQMPFDAAMRSTGMNNDNSWKSYLQNYDQFKYNEQWPYQILSDQQRIGISANQ